MSSQARKISVVAAAILALVLVWYVAFRIMTVEQCPDEYTQAQIDASDCIIGANIGGGLALIALVPVTFTISWFTYQYVRPNKSLE